MTQQCWIVCVSVLDLLEFCFICYCFCFCFFFFFFKQKTAYEIGLGIPAEPLFRSLPFQLLRLSLATPSRWTPLALSVFLHCVVALLLTLLETFLLFMSLIVTFRVNSGLSA